MTGLTTNWETKSVKSKKRIRGKIQKCIFTDALLPVRLSLSYFVKKNGQTLCTLCKTGKNSEDL